MNNQYLKLITMVNINNKIFPYVGQRPTRSSLAPMTDYTYKPNCKANAGFANGGVRFLSSLGIGLKNNTTSSSATSIPMFDNPNKLSVKSTCEARIKHSKGLPLEQGLAYVTNGEGLVFIKKRGSIQANSHIIGYSFPGVGLVVANTTDALGRQSLLGKAYYDNHSSAKNGLNSLTPSPGAPKSVNSFNRFKFDNAYKFLFSFFKSMYCYISKPTYINSKDKLKIQLFYFMSLPKVLNDAALVSYLVGVGSAYYESYPHKLGQVKKSNSRNFARKASTRNWSDKNEIAKKNLKNLVKSDMTKVYSDKFKIICNKLSKFFNKPVELELIRLHHPYNDSSILVRYLGSIINKKNISVCIHKLLNKNIVGLGRQRMQPISRQSLLAELQPTLAQEVVADARAYSLDNAPNPLVGGAYYNNYSKCMQVYRAGNLSFANVAYLSGLNIQISGRLMKEPIIPRITTKKFEKGFTATGKINYSDKVRFTHKNRKGAFSITIKSGQKF